MRCSCSNNNTLFKMIKKLIEKIFGKFCKCKEKTKTTSELLREGFDEEQEALKLEEIND